MIQQNRLNFKEKIKAEMKINYLFLSGAFGAKMNKKEGQVALKQDFLRVSVREGE